MKLFDIIKKSLRCPKEEKLLRKKLKKLLDRHESV